MNPLEHLKTADEADRELQHETTPYSDSPRILLRSHRALAIFSRLDPSRRTVTAAARPKAAKTAHARARAHAQRTHARATRARAKTARARRVFTHAQGRSRRTAAAATAGPRTG